MPIPEAQNPYAPPDTPATPATPQPAAPPPPVPGGESPDFGSERRSVLLCAVLSVVTLGFYPSIWFLRRRAFLDRLRGREPIGALAVLPLASLVVVCVISFGLGLAEIEVGRAVDRGLSVAAGAMSVIAGFRVGNILRSEFARSGRFIPVSSAAIFFFGVLYLQHKINQAAATRPRA